MAGLAGAVLSTLKAPPPVPAPKAKGKAKAKAKGQAKAKAPCKRVKIDLDEDVAAARMQTQLAKQQLRRTTAEARCRERKRQRLTVKAAKIGMDDLLRINTYKRVNLVNAAMNKDMEAVVSQVFQAIPLDAAIQLLSRITEERKTIEALMDQEKTGQSTPLPSLAGSAADPPPQDAGHKQRELQDHDIEKKGADEDEEQDPSKKSLPLSPGGASDQDTEDGRVGE